MCDPSSPAQVASASSKRLAPSRPIARGVAGPASSAAILSACAGKIAIVFKGVLSPPHRRIQAVARVVEALAQMAQNSPLRSLATVSPCVSPLCGLWHAE